MSLRKFIAILAMAATPAVLSLGANPTPATAATGCPEQLSVYAGSYVRVNLACYDSRIAKQGYHLFAVDGDNPPALGWASRSYLEDYSNLSNTDLDYAAKSGVSGTDAVHYVLRKGTTGTDYVNGEVTLQVMAVPAPSVWVRHRLTHHHGAAVTWSIPTDAPMSYTVTATNYNQMDSPWFETSGEPGENVTWQGFKLARVDYSVFMVLGEDNWDMVSSGWINTKTGVIHEYTMSEYPGASCPTNRKAVLAFRSAHCR